MPRADSTSERVTARRPLPTGVSAGTPGLLLAWLGGAAIARLTGATPVVIVLAAGTVWLLASAVTGLWSATRVRVVGVELPPSSTQGDTFAIAVTATAPAALPVWIEVDADPASGADPIASGWLIDGRFEGSATFARRGLVTALDVRARTAGRMGLVWWSRRFDVAIDEHLVAPRPMAGGHATMRTITTDSGEMAGRPGSISGDIDGLRPWREGDSEKSVHWASSIRTRELIVHDRRHESQRRWIVRARSGLPEPDVEAGLARATIDAGLRSGALVSAAVDEADPVVIPDAVAAARWTALVDLGPGPVAPAATRAGRWRAEPETRSPRSARWWAAAATVISVTMLTEGLAYSRVITAAVVAAVICGALSTARPLESGRPLAPAARTAVAIGALAAFALVAAQVSALSGLLSVLRGPLPQILLVLIGLHGFECRDRRTVRVGLGISAVVTMYASGMRVDDHLVWWLVAWALCFGLAMTSLMRPPTGERSHRQAPAWRTPTRWTFPVGGVAAGLAVTVLVLVVVPVPDGPARLTLPTLIENAATVDDPGTVVSPTGDPAEASAESGSRGDPGVPGGYVGFAQSMDTSVRGALSDEVVMRVRAPAPAFWRGQTFDRFDGRIWYADDEEGTLRFGPNIDVPPALGDLRRDDRQAGSVDDRTFVQTYYVESDMPNVIFAAYRPDDLVLDADAWVRPDGAIRASTVLPAGSVYTVVSRQPLVTEDALRRQRHVPDRLSAFGRIVLSDYLVVPPTTSEETVALAAQLAEGQRSTYDVVKAYEAWLAENVEYDLDSPRPADGVDAVHDFLFDSRRGFCEQIASALTVMLRSQGVPARLATGFVAGERDPIAGVYEVRARDAHAWVEVWFPEIGWHAFDPTASVPLSADAGVDSIGSDLARRGADFAAAHPVEIGVVVALVLAITGSAIAVLEIRRRRRRGRWGLLQDRFRVAAGRRGAVDDATNLARASTWTSADDAAVAREVAETLDRVAFDPLFDGDDATFETTRSRLGTLVARRR